MVSESNKRAASKYKKKVIVQKSLEFNRNTDLDILEYLENDAEPFATKCKRLIREEMQRKNK